MRKFAVILGITLVCSTLGCHGTKSSSTGQSSRRTGSNSRDPFYSINYSQASFGQSEDRQGQPGSFDQLFPQNGPIGNIMTQNSYNTKPQDTDGNATASASRRTSRKQGQSEPMTIYRPEAPDTMAIAESGPHHISLIYPSPEYGIIKLDKLIPQEVDLSIPFKYTIVITNLTNATLTHVVLTELIAPSFQFKGASPVPQQSGNQLVWRLESLGPKTSERIEITGIPSNLDILKHSTGITYTIASSSNIRVVQSTLELTRNVPAEALLGDTLEVEYVVKNTGSGTAQDVKIVEPLPAGMTTQEGKNEVRFDVGGLRSGQSRTYTAQLKPARTGTFINKAKVLSSSNAQAESAATPVQIRRPVLSIRQNGPERVYLGRPITYEISVLNQGDGPANDTVLENVIPTGVTDIQVSPEADISGTKLTWALGTLPPNSAKAIRVSFKPTATGIFSSTTTANAHCADSTGATIRTAIVGIPSIRLDVIDLEDPVEIGGTATYIISAVNEGTASDHNLRIVCDLEDKLQYVSASGPSQASLMGNALAFSQLRTLGPSEKVTWRVVTKAIRSGSVRFKVTLSSDELTRPVEQTEATFLYE